MKNLRKIIGLFIAIFLIGIAITYFTVNTTLNKKPKQETVEAQKDTVFLIEAEKQAV